MGVAVEVEQRDHVGRGGQHAAAVGADGDKLGAAEREVDAALAAGAGLAGAEGPDAKLAVAVGEHAGRVGGEQRGQDLAVVAREVGEQRGARAR